MWFLILSYKYDIVSDLSDNFKYMKQKVGSEKTKSIQLRGKRVAGEHQLESV